MRKNAERDQAFWLSRAGQQRLSLAQARQRALEVRCFDCQAAAGEPCRWPNGVAREVPHKERFR